MLSGITLFNRISTASSSDAADLEPLTPNQFLLGRSTIDNPIVVFNGGYAAKKKGFWAHNQFMKMIWDKWMKEYLPRLTTRKKWATEEKRHDAVGDLVWLCDKQNRPFNYPMGIILELHTGYDEVWRSALVETNQKQFKRPLVNLVPLEIDRNDVFLATNKLSKLIETYDRRFER